MTMMLCLTVLPQNAMSCVSLYTRKKSHNEFAICYRATNPGKVALNYWIGTVCEKKNKMMMMHVAYGKK